MRLVIDANIFISGLFWAGKPGIVVDRVLDQLDVLLVTDDIINELEDTIKRPKFKKDDRVISAMRIIKENCEKITTLPEHKISDSDCRDPKDIKYLECALAGNADCIITGDNDLLTLMRFRGIRIMTVREYLDIVGVYQ